MIISLVAAMADNRVIGCSGTIPWDLPEDRRRFRDLTMGHPVLMGRRTFASIGHPLPGRRTIVLTRQGDFRAEGCDVAHDLGSALSICEGHEEIFIAGGEELYREALPYAQRIYLTIVHQDCAGDVSFPSLPAGDFRETSRLDGGSNPTWTFLVFERLGSPRAW